MRFISGLQNYHIPGIDGYIIRNRKSDTAGMIRVVHVLAEGLLTLHKWNGDFSFAPHNHRQNIKLIHLAGAVHNISFDFNPRLSGHFGYEYRFNSELIDGRMGVHYHGCGDLDIADVVPITARGILSESQTVHTIMAEPGSAWLIVEGDLATMAHPHHKNLCYSKRNDFQLSATPDLYRPMRPHHLEKGWTLLGVRVEAALRNLGIEIEEEERAAG